MENNKIHIEELIREIDAEKRKGPKLDADKIIRQANWEIERRELEKQFGRIQ